MHVSLGMWNRSAKYKAYISYILQVWQHMYKNESLQKLLTATTFDLKPV